MVTLSVSIALPSAMVFPVMLLRGPEPAPDQVALRFRGCDAPLGLLPEDRQHVNGTPESDGVHRMKGISVPTRDYLQDMAAQTAQRLDIPVSEPTWA